MCTAVWPRPAATGTQCLSFPHPPLTHSVCLLFQFSFDHFLKVGSWCTFDSHTGLWSVYPRMAAQTGPVCVCVVGGGLECCMVEGHCYISWGGGVFLPVHLCLFHKGDVKLNFFSQQDRLKIFISIFIL